MRRTGGPRWLPAASSWRAQSQRSVIAWEVEHAAVDWGLEENGKRTTNDGGFALYFFSEPLFTYPWPWWVNTLN